MDRRRPILATGPCRRVSLRNDVVLGATRIFHAQLSLAFQCNLHPVCRCRILYFLFPTPRRSAGRNSQGTRLDPDPEHCCCVWLQSPRCLLDRNHPWHDGVRKHRVFGCNHPPRIRAASRPDCPPDHRRDLLFPAATRYPAEGTEPFPPSQGQPPPQHLRRRTRTRQTRRRERRRGQVPLPRQHEPRGAHADEWRPADSRHGRRGCRSGRPRLDRQGPQPRPGAAANPEQHPRLRAAIAWRGRRQSDGDRCSRRLPHRHRPAHRRRDRQGHRPPPAARPAGQRRIAGMVDEVKLFEIVNNSSRTP